MIISSLSEFADEYTARAADVQAADHRLLNGALRRWLSLLDGVPAISTLTSSLESADGPTPWVFQTGFANGAVNFDNIEWPPEIERNLGVKLHLCRWQVSKTNIDFAYFSQYFARSSEIGKNAHTINAIQLIFHPLKRDLLNYIRRHINNELGFITEVAGLKGVGASVDVAKSDADALISALDLFREQLQSFNARDDGEKEDISRRAQEVSAAKELLLTRRVRGSSLIALLEEPVRWAFSISGGVTIGVAGNAVWTLILRLLG